MRPETSPRQDQNSIAPLGDDTFAAEHAAQALEIARGSDQIRAAALDQIFSGITHDDDSWPELCRLAQVGYVMQLVPSSLLRRCEEIDEYRNHASFIELTQLVRVALAKAPVESLKRLAVERITEDERSPMQFSLDDPRPRRLSQAAILRRGKRMALKQIAATPYAKKKNRSR